MELASDGGCSIGECALMLSFAIYHHPHFRVCISFYVVDEVGTQRVFTNLGGDLGLIKTTLGMKFE